MYILYLGCVILQVRSTWEQMRCSRVLDCMCILYVETCNVQALNDSLLLSPPPPPRTRPSLSFNQEFNVYRFSCLVAVLLSLSNQ